MPQPDGTRMHVPLPAFDPGESVVVMSPERPGAGYWVGCPGMLHEPAENRFLLTYRQRRPRGHPDLDRGWRCAVAVSADGVEFRDVWSIEKTVLGSPSMERCCLVRTPEDRYQLFLSYVDPTDNRWRVDVVEAAEPGAFDVTTAEPVLTAASTGTEGVKDPYILRAGPTVYLFASFAAPFPGGREAAAKAHATADVYNVGVTTHPTGLATSRDGRAFTWHGAVLGTGEGWDRYQARLTSVVPTDDGYLGFYDGSASHEENYEERCGLAASSDLTTWHKLTPERPWLAAPHATGSVRYVAATPIDGEWWVYFEMTRPDGAHELRLHRRVALPELTSALEGR